MARWAVPAWLLAEVAAFVLVGRWTSVWAVLGLVILAGVVGLLLMRQGGGRALGAARAASGRSGRRDPVAALTQGGVQVVAGLLLLLPGFLSDLAALALLVPPLRRAILGGLSLRVAGSVAAMRPARRPAPPPAGPGPLAGPGPIIEAEWEESSPPPARPGTSGWTRP